MRIATTIALACLAGCASTPAALESQAPTATFNSTLEAQAAANCIARNAENFQSALNARTRYEGNRAEVVVSLPGEAGPRALAKLEDRTGRLWLSSLVWPKDYADRFQAALLKGC